MVKNLIIQCPSCHQACELFLSSNAAIIVLNCPHCWTPIISNRTGVYVLPEQNMQNISNGKGEFDILKFLRSMSEEKNRACAPIQKNLPQLKYSQWQLSSSGALTTVKLREEVISQDDITNLRIHLETCHDSLDFINRL